jgi:hypothetical protein
MTHSLLDPAVTPENGEEKVFEVSSIALCTELSFPDEGFAGLVAVSAGFGVGAALFTSPC